MHACSSFLSCYRALSLFFQVTSCLKCDKSNGHVYVGSYTGDVILFDFNSHRELWRRVVTLPSTGRPLRITCLDIKGTKLALGGASGETVIYDLENFNTTQVWTEHTQRVAAIAWAGESLVYTASHDGY